MMPERTPDKWPCGMSDSGFCSDMDCRGAGCLKAKATFPHTEILKPVMVPLGDGKVRIKHTAEPEPEDRENIDIEDRLISAFIVWAICPAPGPRGVKSNMPEHLRSYFDEYGRLAATTPRVTPTPREITLAEEALDWFGMFMKGDNSQGQKDKTSLITVVILDKIYRGGRMDWSLIQARMRWGGARPNTIRMRYERAIIEMAEKLDVCAHML